MYCHQCGAENHEDNLNCVQCGASLHYSGSSGAAPPATSGKAVASMVCSIAGLFMCLFVGQIAGLILGYMARNEIRASGGALTGEGFATAGIIVGWVGIVIDILLVVLYLFIFIGVFALDAILL